MCTGTHTNEHIAQHSKAGQGISMLQLICFFNKDTLAASCAMGNEKKSNGHLPLNQVIIQALIGKLHCILKWHKLLKETSVVINIHAVTN